MKTITKFLMLLIVVMLYNCNSMNSIAKIKRQSLFKNNGKLEATLFTAHTDATQRISIIMADSTGKFKTFSENPPDAALESAMSVFAKATVNGKKAGKVDAETKVEFAKSIAELGKRSEAINFQRDGMFRLSELYNNGALGNKELVVLIDSLQSRTVRIVELNANNELKTTELKIIQEINSILKQADSTSTKPTTKELISLMNKKNN